MDKDTKICPTCGEVIFFVNKQDTKICPKCGEVVNK